MSIIVPSSPADRQKLKLALGEIVDSMTRQAAEKDHVKEVITTIKETFNLDPKYIRKMAKIMYDQSFSDLQQENEDFELLYESIVEGMNADDDNDDDNDDDDES